MKIYIISDTHFGHDKVVELCGRPEDHSELILENIRKIPRDCLLIHLGDFCIGNDFDWHMKFTLACQNRRRILVRGNHDHKSDNWYMSNGWDFVCDEFSAKYFGKNILFTHKPSENSQTYDYNIHGHLHNTRHHEGGKCGNHLLFSLEEQKYQPINLEKFISSPKKALQYQELVKNSQAQIQ